MSYIVMSAGSVDDAFATDAKRDNNYQYVDSDEELKVIIALALEDGVIPIVTNLGA